MMELNRCLLKSIEEAENWLKIADSELLGICLQQAEREQVETVIRTLKHVQTINFNLKKEADA